MIMKLVMEHYVLKFYKVFINDEPELTLTYFTTMSNLAKLVFVQKVGTDISTLTKYITTSDNSSDLAKPGVTQIFIGSF